MEGHQERQSAKKESLPFVRPQSQNAHIIGKSGGKLVYEDGSLFALSAEGVKTTLTEALPKAEWYEVVEIAQSPANALEIWIAIGGVHLLASFDGGNSFKR